MFGIGTPELLVILAVALIVIGPKKLPDLAKSLGRALGEFKRATNDLKQSLEQESGLDEVRGHLKGAKHDALSSLGADRKQLSTPSDSGSSPAGQPAVSPAAETNGLGAPNPDSPAESDPGTALHPVGGPGLDSAEQAPAVDDKENSKA